MKKTAFILITVLSLSALETHLRADDAPSAPTNLLPINDNTAPPFFGVYRWGQGGCVDGKYDAYGPWLHRNVMWAEDFMPTEGWDKLEGQQWQLGTWGPWVKKQAGRRYILSLPILVGSWDGKGPNQGPAAHVPVSLDEGAKGTYNEYYKHLAENLLKYGLDDTIIRVGWEFNGGWYIWRAQDAKKAAAYAQYFKQIVTAMRSVPGTEKLKFVWNPAMEPWWPYDPEIAWPGDDVVDYVGVDVYDQSWQADTYPIPADASDDETLKRQKNTWENVTDNKDKMGLPYWVDFAKKHNKPLVIPEWGACIRSDKHGGNDNAYFIEQMYNFIQNPDNNVYFASYFDVSAGDGDHRFVPEPNKKDPANPSPTKLPKAAAKYIELFTLPDGKQAPVGPAPDAAAPATNAPTATAPAASSP
jgi:hypothetical protein